MQMSSKPAYFTRWVSAVVFDLARSGAVLGHMRFSSQEAFSRPDFPLERHSILPSNVAIVSSCLGSSHCFEFSLFELSSIRLTRLQCPAALC